MDWTTACPDWERRVVDREGLIPFSPLFSDEAAAAMDVFDGLRIVDVAGSPTIGDACRPWVRDFAAAVFGAYNAETGRRLISEFLLLVSKKNSKSTIAAGVMMTALIRNWRQSAEYLILAPTIEIANNSFIPARDMVKADEELSDLFHIQENIRTITHRGTRAQLKVVAADNETVSGKKATGILVDELWLLGKRPNAENMLREATGGLASRPEGFVIYLTTHSDEAPVGVMAQKLKYARDVRDGRITDRRFLPVLYEFPRAMLQADAYREKANFYVTNPNLGLSVDVEFLERQYDLAIEAGEKSLQGFVAKHLNVEVGLGLRGGWVGAELWLAAAEPGLTLDAILDRCEVVEVGIDGGGADDLLGLAVLGRERETRRWLLWVRCWASRIVLHRRKSIAAQLHDFADKGELTIVDQPGPEVEEVADLVAEIEAAGLLHAVGVDPYGIGEIVDALAERGISGNERVVGIPQGWKVSAAIKTAERKLANGTLMHADQSIMNWAVGNAKAEAKGNAIAIEKSVAGSAKIDPLVAALNAIALMSRDPEAKMTIDAYLDDVVTA